MPRKPDSRMSLIVAVAFVVAFIAGSSGRAHAFKERWHKAIAWSALSFLKPEYLAKILEAQDRLDDLTNLEQAGVDDWHFNDCGFTLAAKKINGIHKQTVALLGIGQPARAADSFGQLLHTAQDFYAHSNWTDLKGSDGRPLTALVDSSEGDWVTLDAWKPIGPGLPVPVSRTGDRPKNTTVLISSSPDRETVAVQIDNEVHPALISGTATLRKNCPEEASIGHWEKPTVQHGGLAKDYPCRSPARAFHTACTFALRQTYQEWCRLVATARRASDEGKREALAALLDMIKTEEQTRALTICDEKAFLRADFPGACR